MWRYEVTTDIIDEIMPQQRIKRLMCTGTGTSIHGSVNEITPHNFIMRHIDPRVCNEEESVSYAL